MRTLTYLAVTRGSVSICLLVGSCSGVVGRLSIRLQEERFGFNGELGPVRHDACPITRRQTPVKWKQRSVLGERKSAVWSTAPLLRLFPIEKIIKNPVKPYFFHFLHRNKEEKLPHSPHFLPAHFLQHEKATSAKEFNLIISQNWDAYVGKNTIFST